MYPKDIVEKADPVRVIESFEKHSLARAKKGLKEGLRELILKSDEFPTILAENVDTDLQKNNLPNLKFLKTIVHSTLQKVLKRKKIINIDEFYTVKEFVIDLESELTDEERHLLDKYLSEFELGIFPP